MFDAIWLEKENGATVASLRRIEENQLPEGDTLVRVEYSSLNYKDGLAITGRSPVVRSFPMVPGIDFAGRVLGSTHPAWSAGDPVLLTGWGHGEQVWGGLAQRARVPGDRLLRIPAPLDSRTAMAIGTAGFTAMLALMALERNGVRAGSGPILVTGAGGGVGGFAVRLLARAGYAVTAVTGRPAEAQRLRRLGASDVLGREVFSSPGKPLAKEQWAGVVDSVGSHTLVNACAATRYGGVVAACGLAQGMDFPGSVAPFILRGVTLAGIDSVQAPNELRVQAWERLAKSLEASDFADLADVIPMSEVVATAQALLAGQVAGRKIVRVDAQA